MPVRVEMPSGAWAELRDKLQARDKFATQGGFTVEWQEGKQLMPSGVSNTMMKNLLGVIITEWGGPGLEGIAIPEKNIAGADILDSLDIDDYEALAAAAEPLLRKLVMPRPNQQAQTGDSTTPSSSSSPTS
jgi:hypothetical protein